MLRRKTSIADPAKMHTCIRHLMRIVAVCPPTGCISLPIPFNSQLKEERGREYGTYVHDVWYVRVRPGECSSPRRPDPIRWSGVKKIDITARAKRYPAATNGRLRGIFNYDAKVRPNFIPRCPRSLHGRTMPSLRGSAQSPFLAPRWDTMGLLCILEGLVHG